MPIPGSTLNDFISVDGAIDMYPSVCTLYKPVKTQDTTGQEVRSFAVVDLDHTDVPCRITDPVLINIRRQEFQRAGEVGATEAQKQVNLAKWFADIDLQWRILVDDVMYEILAVGSDGNSKFSRLLLGQIFPFNA